jgi:hypothetical protein
MDVLKEVKLLVAGAGPEIVAVDDEAFFRLFASFVNDGDAALFSKGRIGEDHVVFAVLGGEGVFGDDGQPLSLPSPLRGARGRVVAADAVEEEVHGAEAGDAVHEFDAEDGSVSELAGLRFIQPVGFEEIIVSGEEKTAGAAGGIANGLPGLRRHNFDHRGDERTGGEVLACAAFDIFGVLLEETFVGVTFHVGGEAGPLLLVDEINDEAAELGRVLDFVLGFAEDGAEHAATFAEFFESVAVMGFEIVAVELHEGGPAEAFGNGGWFVEGGTALLIRHFKEEEIGELFDIVAVGEAIVAENVAVVPEFLDELLGIAHFFDRELRGRRG